MDVRTAETVILSISVEGGSPVEQGIRGELDTGDEGSGREGCLLDISVIVLGVPVQG